MSIHQDQIDAHCDNIWEEQAPIEIGALISGVGVLLLIAVGIGFIVSQLWADVPVIDMDSIVHNVTHFNFMEWARGLPEWSDYH